MALIFAFPPAKFRNAEDQTTWKTRFAAPVFAPSLFYENPCAALDWLEKAFGFETVMRITDANGVLVHAEMRYGDALLYIGSPWNEDFAAPGKTGGRNTANIHVRLPDGIDAHCESARAAGAIILQEPQDQFYGDHTSGARCGGAHLDLRAVRPERQP